MNELWNDNFIQFARLISELDTVGAFTEKVINDLSVEMGLEIAKIEELIDRAKIVFDNIKETL